MRFQQLKSDSNIIMRKKLVKSKKNWVVISSLMFAGGMFLFGTPDMIQAATVKIAVAHSMPSNIGGGSSSPALNPVNKDTKTPAKTIKKVITSIKSPAPVADVPSKKTEPVVKPVGTNVQQDTLVTDTSKKPTETTTKPIASTKSASNMPTDTKPQVTKPIQAPETSPVKGQENTIETVSKNDNVTGWEILNNGTILRIYGPLTDQKGGNTEHWGGYTKQITTINIDKEVNAPLNSSYLFANMENLTTINNLGNLKFTSDKNKINTTNTEGMFQNDSKITEIDLSKSDLWNIHNISHMFENDKSLQTIIFSNNSFKSITNGSYAFANDVSLNNLKNINAIHIEGKTDPSSTNGWLAKEATDLRAMFKNDKDLKDINIYSWGWPKDAKTGDSTKGEGMFDGTSLTSITLNKNLRFDPKTYLTSDKGSIWIANPTDPIPPKDPDDPDKNTFDITK